jgi:ABC-2 type transport system ATP-binding protein
LVGIRDLIKEIGKSKTVLLSTHIMQEVEAICDRVIIINRGKIVADDKAENLQLNSSKQTVYVEFDGNITKSQLGKIAAVTKIETVGNGWLLEGQDGNDLRKEVAEYARDNGLLVLTMRIEERSLEEVFKELTK